jgi:hypothetical protein
MCKAVLFALKCADLVEKPIAECEKQLLEQRPSQDQKAKLAQQHREHLSNCHKKTGALLQHKAAAQKTLAPAPLNIEALSA